MLGFVKRWARKPPVGSYDAQTLQVMDRVLNEKSACVDVGAHAGSILEEMLSRSPEGQHFAFEPLPDFYAKLERRFGRHSNVHLHCCALADETGPTTFQHVVSRPTYSGLRRRRMDRPNEVIIELNVERRRLDDMIPAHVTVDFLKIDVEGGEYGVLSGGQNTLRRSRPVVVFEHGLGGADYYGVKPEQVYALLRDCGLKVSLMARFLADEPPLDQAEFVEQFCSGAHYYFMAY